MRVRKALLIFALAAGAAQAEAPQQQLSQVQQNLAASKQTQVALQQKLQSAQKDYAALQNHSAELAERLQVSERRVTTSERELASVNDRLAAKQKEFDARKTEYADTIATLLRMHALPMTAIFAQPDDVQQLMRTASVLEKTNQAVAARAQALAKDMKELRALKQEAAERRTHTEQETTALDSEQVQLNKALKARQKLQAQLAADNNEAEEKVATLSKQSESLQSLIGKLDAQARDEQAKAKQKSVPPAKPMKKFEGSKGSARAPVSGELIHRFGERKSANENYRGDVFRARSGSTVVAPYDGEIVFTGPFRDYGNMVLIKHANGYISLIAGVGKLTAALNQPVTRGEPIAVMPGDASSEAYVELRDSDAKPIDPGDWFANVASK